MVRKTLNIDVSYGQIAVFWSSLHQPFNDWTQRHVDQGFSWRPESVSFRTLTESGAHLVELDVVDQAQDLGSDVVRAIEVPFEVPADGSIEVSSISDSAPLSLHPGIYRLRCEFLDGGGEGVQRVRLVFSKDTPHFALLRADEAIKASDELLTTAKAAAT